MEYPGPVIIAAGERNTLDFYIRRCTRCVKRAVFQTAEKVKNKARLCNKAGKSKKSLRLPSDGFAELFN
jgi:hypothetical protein